MYIVQTCMYIFVQLEACMCFNLYKHVHVMYISCTYMTVTFFLFTYMFVQVCTADVLCTDGYIHSYNVQTLLNSVCTLMYPFGPAFLFALLAGL